MKHEIYLLCNRYVKKMSEVIPIDDAPYLKYTCKRNDVLCKIKKNYTF